MVAARTEFDRTDVEQLLQRVEALERQLVQLQKLSSIGALASSITHEFNNVLTTIINYAKLGLRKTDEESRQKAFEKILTAGQRASKLTCGMLSFARGGSSRQEPTDLVSLVQSVLVLVEKDLQMHRISLHTDFSSRPQVVVNVGQIQQVLMNLIINARQAMPGGGRLLISVRTSADPQRAEITVRDTGCGIPADMLPRIFDPFFSTKAADRNGQGGSGLGLALCRQIIEAHQGRIRVESAPGQGTSFTLKLPLAPAAVSADFVTASN